MSFGPVSAKVRRGGEWFCAVKRCRLGGGWVSGAASGRYHARDQSERERVNHGTACRHRFSLAPPRQLPNKLTTLIELAGDWRKSSKRLKK